MSKKLILIAGTLLLAGAVLAQPYTSPNGFFQVDQIKGCAPFTITITSLSSSCTPVSPCNVTYGNGDTDQIISTTSYTYTTPGVFELAVLAQGPGNDKMTITVVDNIEPDFEIYTCANSDVTIKVLEKAYQQLVIDFTNDGIPESIIPSGNNAIAYHDYAAPGNQTITVRGRNLNSADNCDSKVKTFDALAVLPAPIINTLTILDKSKIKLDFTLQANIQYRLEIAVNSAGPFQILQTLYDTSTFTVSNLKTDEDYYCFRLSAFDACTGANGASAPIVCSQKFTLNIQSGVNQLDWVTANTGIQSFDIERNQAQYLNIGPTATGFPDSNIDCKTNYCYQLITRYPNGAKSISLEQCGVSFKIDSPSPIIDASAMVNDQGVNLEWIQDPASNPPGYTVLRSVDKQNFASIATPSTTQFQDKNYTVENNFSYRIDYTDECDNKSPAGIIINPIKLTGSIDNNVITLNWNEYEGWTNGVSQYILDKFDKQGKLIQSLNLDAALTYIDDKDNPNQQFITYRIRAIPNQSGLSISNSNSLDFTKDSNIFSPTAFTPNGDQLNDRFFVSGQFIVKMEWYIFNRWGELIFVSKSKDDTWDGTFNGKPVAEDAYVWSAEVTDFAGRTFKESGSVLLFRSK